jgi:hypothetical protein
MRGARWIAFIVGTSVLAMAEVGCSDWFGNDLAPYNPPDAAKPPGSDAHPEATTEGGRSEGGIDVGADTGADTEPTTDAGRDASSQDASDASQDADAD